MKKIFVQTSLMVVAVLAIAVAANAQVSQKYRAEIPFNFDAGGAQHQAGTYVVGPISGALSIRSLKSGKVRMLGLIQQAGDNNWDKPGTLTFVKSNGAYALSEISTPTFQMKMKRTRTDVREVAGSKPSVEIVTINLN